MDDREAHHVWGTDAWRIWNVVDERYESNVVTGDALCAEMRRRGWARLSMISVEDWSIAGF